MSATAAAPGLLGRARDGLRARTSMRARADRRALRRTTWPTAALVWALVTAFYGLWSWRQWARYDVPSWDLGIFTQTLKGWASGTLPIVPIKGPDYMILGDHFHPLLAVLAPVYALFPSGYTLLFLQGALFALGAAIVAAAGARHLGRAAGICLGLAMGLSWGLQSAVGSQFHEIALAVPLLAASCVALIRRDTTAAVLWALPLVLVKEDLGLTVTAVGVVVALRGAKALGIGTAVFGVAAFWLTTSVILPALNKDGVWAYAKDSITAKLVQDPAAAFAAVFDGVAPKLVMVIATLAITLFLATVSPLVLITLPTFAWRIVSDVPYHWSLDWHYSAVLMPVVFAAMIDALITRRSVRHWATPAAVGALVLALLLTIWFPGKKLFTPDYWSPGDRVAGAAGALALVPDGATVVTDITPMAYLAPRAEVFWLGNENPAPEYVVLFSRSGVFGEEAPTSAAAYAAKKWPEVAYTDLYSVNGWLVAKRS